MLELESERPLPGVQVELTTPDLVVHSTTTDEAGCFRAHLKIEGPCGLRLLLAGYGEARSDIHRGHETLETAATYYLGRSASIAGTVKTLSGEPLRGAEILVQAPYEFLAQPLAPSALESWARFTHKGEQGPLQRADPWSAVADERGEFRIDGLPSRVPLRALAVHKDDDLASKSCELGALSPGEVHRIVLAAGPLASIKGRIVDQDGNPMQDISVWLVPAATPGDRYLDRSRDEPAKHAKTNGDGDYRFKNLRPGSWRIGPAPTVYEAGASWGLFEAASTPRNDTTAAPTRSRGHRVKDHEHDFAPWGTYFELASDEDKRGFDLTVPRGLFLRGQVVDDAGKPIWRARVTARAGGTGTTRSTRTSQDGTFAIGPVTTAMHEVRAEHDSCRSAPQRMFPHETTVLRIEQPAGSIRGRVTFHGEPVQGASVVVERLHSSQRYQRSTHSKAEGSFRFQRMASGEYGVSASNDGRVGVVSGIRPGDQSSESLEIELQELLPLRVRHLGAEPLALVVARRWGVVVASAPVSQGIPVTLDVPRGPVTVEAYVFAAAPDPTASDLESAAPAHTRELTVDAAGAMVDLP